MPTTQNINDLIVKDGQINTLPLDANGNVIANVNHRTGTLATLAAATDGGDGEIAVATDLDALVRYDSSGDPHIYGGMAPVKITSAYDVADGITAVASGTTPLVTLGIDNDRVTNSQSGIDLANNSIVGAVPVNDSGNAYIYEIVVDVEFPASATGIRRTVLQVSSNNGTSFVTLRDLTITPTDAANPTAIRFTAFYRSALSTETTHFRLRATQTSGASQDVVIREFAVKSIPQRTI